MTATSLAELHAIRAECRTMVLRRAGWSGAAAALPIPAADLGVDLGLFLNLIPAINRRFGLSPEQIDGLDPKAKELVLLSLTSVGSQMVGKAISSELLMQLLKGVGLRITTKAAAKWLPVVGQVAAATISFGVMRMVGNAHVEDCYRVARRALEARATLPAMVVGVS